MTEEQKNRVLNNFLSIIANVSDEEYQHSVWIQGKGIGVDFDETVCCFFDGIYILEDYKDYGITDSQYALLIKFRDAFEKFADDNDWPPEFIDTPEWAQIMERAQEVLTAFNYQKRFQ